MRAGTQGRGCGVLCDCFFSVGIFGLVSKQKSPGDNTPPETIKVYDDPGGLSNRT
jgi:hypothetical protein